MTLKGTDGFKITVENRQKTDGMSDTVTETGEGTYREADGIAYISYSSGNTRVFIKAQRDMITVKRTGDTKSDMRYELGKHTSFDYRTPYGTIKMGIFTESINRRTNENGGNISLGYTLQAGGDKLYNNMMIKIER